MIKTCWMEFGHVSVSLQHCCMHRDDVSGEEWFNGEEWQHLLQQQLADTNRETKQLKEALFAFIQTLDKVCTKFGGHPEALSLVSQLRNVC